MASPAALTRLTVSDVVRRYVQVLQRRVARGDLSPATLSAYRRDLAEFTDLLGADTVLDDIEADDLEDALTVIAQAPDRRFTSGAKLGSGGAPAEGRGPHARARWFAAVRGLFRWALERGYLQVDPTTKLDPPRTPKRAKGARLGIQLEEASTLRGAPARPLPSGRPRPDTLTMRDEALLRLFTESGPRVSEVCSANRSDIRLHEETGTPVLRVLGKGSKERDIPLGQGTLDAIETYLAHGRPPLPPANPDAGAQYAARRKDAEQALFVSVRGWRLAPRDVQRMVAKYTTGTLARRATPHALRHTALTILARSGVDIATVAQIAGHANLSTTSVYMDESMLAAAKAIENSPLG